MGMERYLWKSLWLPTHDYEDFAQIRLWNTIEKYIRELNKRLEE